MAADMICYMCICECVLFAVKGRSVTVLERAVYRMEGSGDSSSGTCNSRKERSGHHHEGLTYKESVCCVGITREYESKRQLRKEKKRKSIPNANLQLGPQAPFKRSKRNSNYISLSRAWTVEGSQFTVDARDAMQYRV